MQVLLFLTFLSIGKGIVWAGHGISLDGTLKYSKGFAHFDYVSTEAVKGGELVLHAIGSFDKLNPFTLRGVAPEGLEMLVFEPLTVSSLDEPIAQYGLVAKDIDIADDKLSVVFTIDENARFSDGNPVTAQDVKYTVGLLKSDKVHPFYSYYYEDIGKVEIIDRLRVKLTFKQVNRELSLIAGQIPVMSHQFFEKNMFEGNELIIPVGSGPYMIESFAQGKYITYKKNPHYWATEHPVRAGMYNFDKITFKYYKDPVVALEAFKAGEFDLMLVNIAKQWARDMKGGKFEDGRIIKKKFPHSNNAGMQGFVMNTRNPLFQDAQVRKAVGLAFDFDWTNKTIFYSQYERSTSYYANSYLAATGLPTGAELQLLDKFRKKVPAEVFSEPMGGDKSLPPGQMRERLRRAAQILSNQGWQLKNGVLQNENDELFVFEIILVNPVFERVMAGYVKNLQRLGIKASYRTIDPSLYTERINNFDFDMCVFVFGQSLSPGNEQRNFWHSSSADVVGSRNLAGIKDPVIDSLVEKIIYAESKEDLTVACRALDRVLWHGYYVVPNWYVNSHRIAYHNKFMMPDILPIYYDYRSLIMTWWQR